MSVTQQLPDHALVAAHVISVAAILGAFAGLMPWLAALAAFCWYVLQIYESKTVQKWLANRREKANAATPPTDPGTSS